ncbi:torsin-1A-interacting protein 2-like isoform X2 [Hemiscyllium ocellatum]|uniref:torsin-1A-interacting protein 2-like isoform X2 n=1 Tax=Hemiscyllium ocellatum TaxID=170820 RepID=UPI0029674BFC|nr:torsin-1A-interacting protein 2-like isoform X2 [Hemiscyllium ocellatum]
MSVRLTRSANSRPKDLKGSSRVKSYAGIVVTSRSPIKNQRKRNYDSDYGINAGAREPPKKSPKATVPGRGSGSEVPESHKKSHKGRGSAQRQSQENPVKEDLELHSSTEPEEMDYSSETNQASPDGNQSEDTVLPQNSADEDMDSDSEVEVDWLQDTTTVSTLQTFSVGPHQAQSTRWRAAADLQATNYRECQNYTDAQHSALSTRLRPIADTYQPTNYRKPHYHTDSVRTSQFIRPSADETKSFFWQVVFPLIGLVVVLSICVFYLWACKKPDHHLMLRSELFLAKWKEMKTKFPNQQDELWLRSSILLKKHVGEEIPTQPVILMFTAAQDAKRTMQCLTRRIAEVYASAFDSSVLEINGSDQKSLDSDALKLKLDNQLTAGFTEGRKAAVIHHFQDLPPSSTFLFYKYCDHENAAFKDVSILITVLLDEPKLKLDLSLKNVEEMVHDFVTKKFCSDKLHMDTDKLSGLWSRVSHVVLPVSPEREIETGDCPP